MPQFDRRKLAAARARAARREHQLGAGAPAGTAIVDAIDAAKKKKKKKKDNDWALIAILAAAVYFSQDA